MSTTTGIRVTAEFDAVEETDALRVAIATAVQQRVDGDAVAFFELPDGGRDYVRTLDLGHPGGASSRTFPADGGFARWLRVNDELLEFSRNRSVWDYLPASERDPLVSMGATACLPLVAEGDLVGFVVICQRETRSLTSNRPALEACGRHGALRWHQLTSRERARTRSETLRRTQQLGVAGQVAASVAHEVRNPLAAIRSLVQFARDVALPDAERTTLLGDVLEEVDRIDQTVTSMLQLSQPASTVRQTVDVADLVRSATRFVRAYAGRRQVLIETVSITERLWVLADERELRQTLTNLLLNACQACQNGGRVTASVSPVDEPSTRWVDITISDSGQGIAPEHLSRLFEPFFTTKPQGTGLGLPFCRDVVERHGGTITVRSTVGVGTSVSVRLPFRESDDVDPRR